MFQSVTAYSKEWNGTQVNSVHNELNIAKTTINITYPNSQTIWTAPNIVELKWITKNIPANKTIKFYLSKDDMVVQELGVFGNNSFASEVKLDRKLQEGTNYRVILTPILEPYVKRLFLRVLMFLLFSLS